ncbi:hypothetical protein NC651_005473 [Populus alba x Populus x berolinensis]|nr:hypothetical protein NC651_005473 [Populus alba x Populus x berolinensis]
MIGDSSVQATSSDVAATETRFATEVGEGVVEVVLVQIQLEEDKTKGRLIMKVRSDMDAVFRDSGLKGPLWEEVSRKLAELGYHRSAKKCKEKFENVYKYHKRTKEGRTGKSEGKSYKFFDELEAFQNHPSHSHTTANLTPPPPLPPPKAQTASAPITTLPWTNNTAIVSHATVPSRTNPMDIMSQSIGTPTNNHTISPMPITSNPINPSQNAYPSSLQNLTTHLLASSSPSSTASDEEFEKEREQLEGLFERLNEDVIKKQEDLQEKFLETIEKYEHERMAREEAWRMQEMARINREHETLIQERSTAAAKDAAVVAFLPKISGQQNSVQTQEIPQPTTTPTAPPPQPIQLRPPPTSLAPVTKLERDNGDNFTVSSSSRWPKVEVEALINLRANLDIKYQENGAKGPLWEDISAGMQKLGYNRSAKRCKEKWENINKYFKKVKESNKKRPEDSKTCPYFRPARCSIQGEKIKWRLQSTQIMLSSPLAQWSH